MYRLVRLVNEKTRNGRRVGPETLLRLAVLTDALKRRTTRLLGLTHGGRVLDVGCGPGADTLPMARLVGPGGVVVGIDHDEEMIQTARKRAREAGIGRWLLHQLADAMALPFRDGVFDACRSERLCQHVADTQQVIAEMVRVVRIGGRLVVADTDWSTLSIDAAEIDTERQIVRFLGESVANGCAGRQLFRLLRRQGLSSVRVDVWPIVWTDYERFRQTSLSLPRFEERLLESGRVSAAAFQRFMKSLEKASERGEFFASANMVLVAGVKEHPLR